MGTESRRNRAAAALAVGGHALVIGALVGYELLQLEPLPVPKDPRVISTLVQVPDAGGGGPGERRAPPAGASELPKAAEATSRRRARPEAQEQPAEVTQPIEEPPESSQTEVAEVDAAEAAAAGRVPEPIMTSVVDVDAAGIGLGSGGGQGAGHGGGIGDGFGLGMAISDPVPLGDYSRFQIPQEDEQPGQIVLAIRLDARGVPASLTVTRSLSPRLDQKALELASKFRFIPCRTYTGIDTPCDITWIFHVGPKAYRAAGRGS